MLLAAGTHTLAAPNAKFSSLAWMVKDLDSAQVLSEHEPDESFNPREAVRLMTLYTALKAAAGKAEESMKIREDALDLEPALKEEGRVRVGVDPKEELHLEVLLRLVAPVGAEDAAVVLASKVSGSVRAFVAAMNKQARALHMEHSLFSSPIAAPEQRTTANDFLLLIRALREEFPEESAYLAEEEFSFEGQTLKNPFTLINPDDKSIIPLTLNRCCMLAGIWTRGGDRQLPARELHFVFVDRMNRSRELDQSSKILTQCQTEFESIELYDAGTVIGRLPVKEGVKSSVDITVSKPVRVTLPRKELLENGVKDLAINLEHAPEIPAPVQKGMFAGVLKIYRNDTLITEYDAVTAEDVDRLNFFERITQKKTKK